MNDKGYYEKLGAVPTLNYAKVEQQYTTKQEYSYLAEKLENPGWNPRIPF